MASSIIGLLKRTVQRCLPELAATGSRRAPRSIVYNALMSADKQDRNRHVAELEAQQMEQQIDAAERTIKQCRQTLAIMREQIKRAMTGGEEQEGTP